MYQTKLKNREVKLLCLASKKMIRSCLSQQEIKVCHLQKPLSHILTFLVYTADKIRKVVSLNNTYSHN
jgi:hypothetical protein